LIENYIVFCVLGAAVGEELPEHCVYVPETAKKAEKQPLLSNNNLEEVSICSCPSLKKIENLR
jgi:hypothetical protein